ncbi:hypothetical protein BC629DRAFT_980515 [Irpex lacteus]|nr:hypothetical protein BC629DRAFT_980515 [Irpex lacteus]
MDEEFYERAQASGDYGDRLTCMPRQFKPSLYIPVRKGMLRMSHRVGFGPRAFFSFLDDCSLASATSAAQSRTSASRATISSRLSLHMHPTPYLLRSTMHRNPPANIPSARNARINAGEASVAKGLVGRFGGGEVLVGVGISVGASVPVPGSSVRLITVDTAVDNIVVVADEDEEAEQAGYVVLADARHNLDDLRQIQSNRSRLAAS